MTVQIRSTRCSGHVHIIYLIRILAVLFRPDYYRKVWELHLYSKPNLKSTLTLLRLTLRGLSWIHFSTLTTYP